jgi:hypothetical protein
MLCSRIWKEIGMRRGNKRPMALLGACAVLSLLSTVCMVASIADPVANRLVSRSAGERRRATEGEGDDAETALPPARRGEALAALIEPKWGLERIRAGQPLRIAVGGLSRSGSTWQFMVLVLLLEAVVERHSSLEEEEAREVHLAYGHRQVDMDGCLSKTYCVAKAHELMPDVVARVDAIFVSHRDLRAVLASSARIFSSCLLYGTQPLMTYFEMYAAWLPYASHDMQYEAKLADGEVLTVTPPHAARLVPSRRVAPRPVPSRRVLSRAVAARPKPYLSRPNSNAPRSITGAPPRSDARRALLRRPRRRHRPSRRLSDARQRGSERFAHTAAAA